MVGKWLLLVGAAVTLAAAQQTEAAKTPDELPEMKPLPELRMPLLPQGRNQAEWAQTFRRYMEKPRADRCSVPLITVVPRDPPRMPLLDPGSWIDNGILMPPPAPPCEDKGQRGQIQSKPDTRKP